MAWIARSIVAAAAALVITAGPAAAQQLKPLTVEQDPNGVDVLSGKTSPRLPTLSIPAAPRLAFTKLYDWHLFLEGEAIADTFGTEIYSLNTLGRESESFKCKDLEFCGDNKDGSSVLVPDRWSGNFWFTKGGSAVKVHYNLRDKYQATITTGQKFYFLATTVAFPDGETLTIAWTEATPFAGFKDHRPASVTSSTGYRLNFTYHSNTYGTAGWSRLQKAEIVSLSAPSVPLASMTYTATTATDIAGRVYTCTNCDNWLGGPQPQAATSLKLPGESANSFTASAVTANHGNGYTHNRFTTDVDSDGVHYDYTYVQGAYNAGSPNPDMVDLLTVTGPSGFSRVIDVEILADKKMSRVNSITNSENQTTHYGYSGTFLRLTSITYPEGNSLHLTYDGPINITEMRQKAKPGSGLADIVQTANYSPYNVFECDQITCFLPNWTRDAKGYQTDYTWASHGGLVTQLDPADEQGKRRKVKNTYDGWNRLIKEEVCEASSTGTELTCGTASSFVRQLSYWNGTRLPLTETITDGVGTAPLTTTYTYDAAGRVLSQDGPLPGSDDTVYFRYDVLGRKIREVGPKGESGTRPATLTTYRQADDQASKVETGAVINPDDTFTPFSQVDTTYDTTKRLPIKAAVSASGTPYSVTQTSYDARNREECSAVRMNPAVFASLPASACTLGAEGTNGPDRITKKLYDSESRVTKIQRALGTPLQQDYATYTYSANGKQLSQTDARGYRAEMTWDGFDRQKRWYFPSPTATGTINAADYEEYGYDANGNRTSLRKRDGSVITFTYDKLNRVTRKTVPERTGLATTHTRDVFYQYDIRGLQTRARFDSLSGEGLTTVYDRYGRATSNAMLMNGVTRTLSNQYDAAGNRTRVTLPDGSYHTYTYGSGGHFNQIQNSGGSVLVDYDYNTRNELIGVLRYSTMADQTYTYDPVGRLASTGWAGAGAADVTWSFTRNPASQILTETQSNDSYSWTGHVDLDRTYAANGLDQYITAGGANFCHDANGNLTADGTSVYLYDVENRLVEKRAQAGGTCGSLSYAGTLQASLRYDPLGRLFEEGSPAAVTRLLYDGDALVAEYNSTGTLLRRYVHGPAAGTDDPLIWWEGGALRMLYADARGSIVLVRDSANVTIALNTYDEYGIPGAANAGRFQYTGQIWLPAMGVYYYKARMYSPTLGRFMQTDPIGYEDQVNLYGYVGNDPVNGVDPLGMAKACTDTPGSNIPSCVTVDADFDNDGADDLTRSQLKQVGNDFRGAILANRGRDLSNDGKPIEGDASISDKAMTSVVSQFIGRVLSGSSLHGEWAKVPYLKAMRDKGWFGSATCAGTSSFECAHLSDPKFIAITGQRVVWHTSPYAPSEAARLILHGLQHLIDGPTPAWVDHVRLDDRARANLRRFGLAGGGCSGQYSIFGGVRYGGLPGC